MGTYWIAVNHDKKEYIDPHKMGIGAKFHEQLMSFISIPSCLFVLLQRKNGYGYMSEASWANDKVEVVPDTYEDDVCRYIKEYKDVSLAAVPALSLCREESSHVKSSAEVVRLQAELARERELTEFWRKMAQCEVCPSCGANADLDTEEGVCDRCIDNKEDSNYYAELERGYAQDRI